MSSTVYSVFPLNNCVFLYSASAAPAHGFKTYFWHRTRQETQESKALPEKVSAFKAQNTECIQQKVDYADDLTDKGSKVGDVAGISL